MYSNAACYIRVSTDEQTEYSPDAQLRLLKDYAGKNNIILSKDHIYIDAGISGRKADKRPAFMKMIAAAKTKPQPFDIILVHKFDRFARSREDSVVYKSLLKKEAGIKVISITESIEDDKFSVILEAMLEAMAEYYSLNLSEEVKKGMTEKALRGELQTPAPFGYRMEAGLLTPHEEEAEVVRRIFYKYVKENTNLRTIAKYINSLGYRTKRGNTFDTRLIEYIIYNPTYIGKMRWTPTGSVINKHDFDNPSTLVIDGRHDAIVDTEIWEEANRLIRARKKNKIPKYVRGGEITTHWLRGMLRCSACGSTLSFGKGSSGKQSAFRCNKYLTGGCTEPQRITVGKIESIVLDALTEDAQYISNLEFKKIDTDVNSNIAEFELYSRRIDSLNAQLERAKQFALNGIDTPDEYKTNKQNISRQMDAVNEQMAGLRKKIDSEYTSGSCDSKISSKINGVMGILLSDAGNTKKNAAINEIISKIIYDKKANSVEIYYYYIIKD